MPAQEATIGIFTICARQPTSLLVAVCPAAEVHLHQHLHSREISNKKTLSSIDCAIDKKGQQFVELGNQEGREKRGDPTIDCRERPVLLLIVSLDARACKLTALILRDG